VTDAVGGVAAGGAGAKTSFLLVRMSSLGDIVLTFPALARLRAQFPMARLVFLTKAAYAPLAAAHPAVDEVVALAPASRFRDLLELARVLRRRRFAGAYDLHANLRSRLVLALAGIPVRGRVETRAIARRMRVLSANLRRWLHRPPPTAAPETSPLQAFAFLRAVDPAAELRALDHAPGGTRANGDALRLPPPPPWLPVRSGGPRDPRRIALCPGARHHTKAWPGYPALADALAARGDQVFVVLGPQDPWPGSGRMEQVVRGGLLDLAAALRAADCAVGNDSGLTHLAVAAGTPAVVLFGATVPELGFLPAGAHRVVERRDLNCRPCSLHGGARCPRGDHACLRAIGPEPVIAAIDALLELGRRRSEMAHAG